MGDSITLSIFWGLILFIASFTVARIYLIALSVLIAFSILNYWIKINIKEFVKSYFLISFIIFFMAIVIVFYLTYDLETSRGLVLLGPPEIEKLSPQEYKAYNYFGFLSGITIVFLAITFFIFPCLLQAYLFKCYSTGEKCKKLSWLIGFVCNIFLLIASVYVVYENL
ncbi:hypothetical protein AJ933_08575 [Campylobacter sp. BCW_6874]|uniref:hypothetical protein n=2 Tax=Campylobacter TaxID=194 RepID=UPI000873B73B|nr:MULTISPECIES: hypothetical protein [unclassified Campylobacter]EAL0243371.1 hypothetical protein [Campylobacter jejuni]EHD9160499.1 hypothetical protein [Campylobacter jejuni]EJM0817656.1 hypothetical protein [Campylobacter jejuni]OEW07150.1 hypothetical protein AJ932_08485 [Campylobacter sp. BCW_6873]OEW07639.1 hypothetical protein AJ933_08575 [Campylobacter sp. BCW_6874]